MGEINGFWQYLYEGIYACNVVINKVPDIVQKDLEFSQELADYCVGQALFLRAFYYFNLVHFFGEEIPMQLNPVKQTSDYYLPPAKKGDLFKLMEDDLKAAQPKLYKVDDLRKKPAESAKELGRVTRGAATALLGKIYLYQGKHTEAAAEFKKIVDKTDGTYGLSPSFRDNFVEAGENNIESLFEIQFAVTAGSYWSANGDGTNQNEASMFTTSRSVNRNVNSQFWFNFAIPRDRVNEFEKDINGKFIDNRVYTTFWGVENGASYDFKGTVFKWDQQKWETTEGGCYGLRKYDYDNFALGKLDNGINFRLIRYADVLLMYAEALHKMGRPNSEVTPLINEVRTRANAKITDQAHLPSAIAAGTLPTVEDLMTAKGWNIEQAIRHERYCELFGENSRQVDIKRWNIGTTALAYKLGWKGEVSYYLPIPQVELDNNHLMKGNVAN